MPKISKQQNNTKQQNNKIFYLTIYSFRASELDSLNFCESISVITITTRVVNVEI